MKPLFIFCTLLLMGTAINAQDNEQIEKIKAQKVAFITEKLGLTPATAQKFWPVYNEFAAKKDSLNNLRSTGRKEMKEKWDKLSPKQKEAEVDRQMQQRWDESKLEQHYHEKFKKILSIDQVLLLYEAEHEFKMRLIRQIRKNKTSQNQTGKDQLISIKCKGQGSEATEIQTIN